MNKWVKGWVDELIYKSTNSLVDKCKKEKKEYKQIL